MNINPRCILNSIHICCFVLTASASMYRDGGGKWGGGGGGGGGSNGHNKLDCNLTCNKYTNNLRRIEHYTSSLRFNKFIVAKRFSFSTSSLVHM